MTIDEFTKKMEAYHETWEYKLKLPFLRIKWWWNDTRWAVKQAWNRAWRGYDDVWHWELHSAHSEQMIKSLNWMIENVHGAPHGLFNDKAKTPEKQVAPWIRVLTTMRDGFQASTDLDNLTLVEENGDKMDWKEFQKREKALRRKFVKGMKLFTKYYHNLWD